MDIDATMEFFKWCSIINFSILAISTLTFALLPDFTYNVHSKIYSLGSKVEHSQIIYALFGNYKIIIIIFNVVPYFALCIMTG